MKIEKVLDLIEKGFKAKTLAKLTESQIDVLHNKLVVNEQVQEVPGKKTYKVGPKGGKVGDVVISQDPNTKEVMVTTETEMTEDETDDVTAANAKGDVELQKYTGQDAPHDANDMAPDGMDDDSDDERKMMGMAESKKTKKNPWAICTAQLADEFGTSERSEWSKTQMKKYERCVMDVKKSLKESKNQLSLYLENQVMKIVEKNLPPKITKGDLVRYLTENEPAVAPKPGTKPKTKPGTRPDKKPRPKHPGKNPNPGENPAPKAKKTDVSPEKAKDQVIDMIMKLLKK